MGLLKTCLGNHVTAVNVRAIPQLAFVSEYIAFMHNAGCLLSTVFSESMQYESTLMSVPASVPSAPNYKNVHPSLGLLRLLPVYKMYQNIKMIPSILKLVSHTRHKYLHFIVTPTQHASEKAQSERVHRI